MLPSENLEEVLVNNQLDVHFFIYICFYSLRVSGSHVPFISRFIVWTRYVVYVTLCKWPCPWFMSLCVDDGVHALCHYVLMTVRYAYQTVIYTEWHTPGVALIQQFSWRPSGMQEHMLLHTRRSSTQSDINQVSHWYNNSPDDGHMAAWNM